MLSAGEYLYRYLQLMIKRSPRSIPDGLNISTASEEEEEGSKENASSSSDVESSRWCPYDFI